MFTKVLIANRGEIAVRIIRACRELGITSVAVYSDADRRALHVRLADEAVHIGPALAGESYLAGQKLIEAALAANVQAIHPGYGFLSENAVFARDVQKAGLVFIGPSPDAMEAMGDKGQARSRMLAAGVPVVPGYQGLDDDSALERAAVQVGFPLLIKAVAGGGGKGMRVVRQPEELLEAAAAARREALHAFSDGRLIIERYIPHARHIEFQVLADQHGHIVHCFERECSLQRRHQKIVEETPSPYLTDALRAQMGMAAVAAARTVGYTNAGTVEFIVDPRTGDFYFLEMNTRLQVEHPVTEMTVGLDLVQWQLRIAAGETLSFNQADLTQRGHAIECRLYAEDPANNFLPATGPLLTFAEPSGPGVRLDSGYTSGDAVTIHYDPLIAKIIVWGEDRPAAMRRMSAALRETVLLGVTHNGQFLQDVLADSQFAAGDFYTTWVEERFGGWLPPNCGLPPEVLIAAALSQPLAVPVNSSEPDPYSPWRAANRYRLGQ